MAHDKLHAAEHADGGADEITSLALGAKPLNGFVNRTDSTLGMSGSNFQITTATTYDVWSNGNKFTKTTTQQVAIASDLRLHYVYFDTSGVIQVSTDAWSVKSDIVSIAMVYKDGSNYVITDERHGWRRDRDWHDWAHDTIGARYRSGLTGTFTNTTLSIVQGVIYDEDIEFDTGGTKTDCQLWYRNAGLTAMRVELGVSTPYKPSGGGVLQYDAAGTLTDATVNRYVNSYVYATNGSAYPIVVVVGQAQHVNLAGARNEAFPSILLNTAEWKLLYRATYQNVGGTPTYVEALDLRLQSTGPATTAASVDHAGLTGRDTANQHPASAITNTPAGSIAATDVQSALNELDSEKAAATHASQHNAGGGDALAIDAVAGTGSLRTLGTAATAACAGNDSRLSDARTPSAHAASHQSGGGDAIKLSDKNISWDLYRDGAVLSTGAYEGVVEVPFDCTITAARLLADQATGLVIDVWKCAYADYNPGTHPVVGDSIVASAPPTLTAAYKSEDTTLTGWTKTLTKGDLLKISVTSVTAALWARLVLHVVPT